MPRIRQWLSPDPQATGTWLTLGDARREFQDALELDYLSALKQQSAGNRTRSATLAGVSRQTIHNLVRKHDFFWNDAGSEDDRDSEM